MKNGEESFSHNKSRCLGCMHSSRVGTGRERNKSSDQMFNGEWNRLTPVLEAKVKVFCVFLVFLSKMDTTTDEALPERPLISESGYK